ncbi:MAG: hydroxymethylbilane synthase [Candidatus Eremiobacter antarcticus]|nr:hydroxymethylbilane synthase [Candidatus Eremiobacteraeota bacterium]MBC5808000.1 hydroxymethylbilane synthase [Candidatus Eremiobacteraeota bacterium]PZR62909.1 MAG: hydroxymethylbilane synthase [Candidatus Eremiobacter sp. RRmetagenome_bin22]
MVEAKRPALRLATRKSPLALAQAQLVADALVSTAHVRSDIVGITTQGDAMRDRSLSAIGGDGVFVKELMQALLQGRADVAVHSMKDLPTELPPSLCAGAVLKRADARDALVSKDSRYRSIEALPPNAVVGTSSLRRSAQVLSLRPDIVIKPLRGNVDSRVRKLIAGDYDAILLAVAGLERIGLARSVGGVVPLDPHIVVPAVAQGALYVQCRADDDATLALLAPLDDAATSLACDMERAFLRRLGGGCAVPIGAYVEMEGDRFSLHACISSADGRQSVRRVHRDALPSSGEGPQRRSAAIAIVEGIADEMLAAGGRDMLSAFRHAAGITGEANT